MNEKELAIWALAIQVGESADAGSADDCKKLGKMICDILVNEPVGSSKESVGQ